MLKVSPHVLALLGAASASFLVAGCDAPAQADSTPIDDNASSLTQPNTMAHTASPAETAAHRMHERMASHEYHAEHQKRMERHGRAGAGGSSMGMNMNMDMDMNMDMGMKMKGCPGSQSGCSSAKDEMKPMGNMKSNQGAMQQPMKGEKQPMDGMSKMPQMKPKPTKTAPAPMTMGHM
jgi:hypothetical protein